MPVISIHSAAWTVDTTTSSSWSSVAESSSWYIHAWCKDYLVVTDYYSHFPEFVRLESKLHHQSPLNWNHYLLGMQYVKFWRLIICHSTLRHSMILLTIGILILFGQVHGILSLTGWWSVLYRQSRCYSRNASQKAKIHTLLFYSIAVLLWQVHHTVLLSCWWTEHFVESFQLQLLPVCFSQKSPVLENSL